MSLPKASTDNNIIQMRIAEFLSREANANVNRSETLTTKTSLPQKNANQVGSSSQVRKSSKPASNPLVPTFMKNTPRTRLYERPTNFVRPRPEDRMIALKPIEIVLPPVMLPFPVPKGSDLTYQLSIFTVIVLDRRPSYPAIFPHHQYPEEGKSVKKTYLPRYPGILDHGFDILCFFTGVKSSFFKVWYSSED